MKKSYVAQLILTLLFGSLGLFYSSVAAGIAFSIAAVVIGGITFGIGLLAIWPASILVGLYNVNTFNIRMDLENRRHQEVVGRGTGIAG